MHFDTRLWLRASLLIVGSLGCFCQYSDDESYYSLVEFSRGGPSTTVILTSPHGGFLGGNLTTLRKGKPSINDVPLAPLVQLPVGGCYNISLDRCVYTLRDCLRADGHNADQMSFRPDARCIIDRSSTSAMYLLTKSIAGAFSPPTRPYTVLNKLTRQYVDPAEDLLVGTFLLESATRVYMDYHRLIAVSKEAIRPLSRGLLIEFVFHKNSQTVQLGYGFDVSRSNTVIKPSESTVGELISRAGLNVVRGNHSLGAFLRSNGFPHVIPLDAQRPSVARLSTHSTRTHADQRFNAILFSYPIERLRKHNVEREAVRIAKAIEQFVQANTLKSTCSTCFSAVNSLAMCCLLFFAQALVSHVH